VTPEGPKTFRLSRFSLDRASLSEEIAMNFSKAELAIIVGQAVMLTLALVAAMVFDVYAPGWMWN
jgi:hypothetical protein